jgi:hypothetical protein
MPGRLDHAARLGLRVQVPVAVEGEADRGMDGPGRGFLGAGAGRDPQGHSPVPKVVDAQPVQAGLPGRRPPDAGAKGDHPQECLQLLAGIRTAAR